MHCFKHSPESAFGVCKACGKGLCPVCAAVDPLNGLACRGACEERIALAGRVLDNSAKTLRAANAMTRSAGWFLIAMGLLFLGFALFSFVRYPQDREPVSLTAFFGSVGLLFALWGIGRLRAPRVTVGAENL